MTSVHNDETLERTSEEENPKLEDKFFKMSMDQPEQDSVKRAWAGKGSGPNADDVNDESDDEEWLQNVFHKRTAEEQKVAEKAMEETRMRIAKQQAEGQEIREDPEWFYMKQAAKMEREMQEQPNAAKVTDQKEEEESRGVVQEAMRSSRNRRTRFCVFGCSCGTEHQPPSSACVALHGDMEMGKVDVRTNQEDKKEEIEKVCRDAGWTVKMTRKKRRMWTRAAQSEEIKLLKTVEPDGIMAFTGVWEEIELAVDSGATETVLSEDMLESIETKPGSASKRGVEYEVANGEKIPNLGEKRFIGYSSEGLARRMTAQICDVNKGLLRVRKVVSAGNRVVFDDGGSYIEDKSTGERMWIEEKNGMYSLKLWVKRDGNPF